MIVGVILNVKSVSAETNNKSLKWGAGFEVNAANFCSGPFVKYWFMDNLGAQATFIAIGGFTGYDIRGIYKFSQSIKLGDEDFNPYLSLGYTSIEEEMAGLTLKGSGVSFSAGLEGHLESIHPNIYYTTQLTFAPFELEAESSGISVSSDYSSFDMGVSMVYYF